MVAIVHLNCKHCGHILSVFRHCHFCDQCGKEFPEETKLELFEKLKREKSYFLLKYQHIQDPIEMMQMMETDIESDFLYPVLLKIIIEEHPNAIKKGVTEICEPTHEMLLLHSIMDGFTDYMVNHLSKQKPTVKKFTLTSSKFCSFCGTKLSPFRKLPKRTQRHFINSIEEMFERFKYSDVFIVKALNAIAKA